MSVRCECLTRTLVLSPTSSVYDFIRVFIINILEKSIQIYCTIFKLRNIVYVLIKNISKNPFFNEIYH